MAQSWIRSDTRLFANQTLPDGTTIPIIWISHGQRVACLCSWHIGMRMDDQEPTCGLAPCASHEAIGVQVMRILQTMPPSDRQVSEIIETEFDRLLGTESA